MTDPLVTLECQPTGRAAPAEPAARQRVERAAARRSSSSVQLRGADAGRRPRRRRGRRRQALRRRRRHHRTRKHRPGRHGGGGASAAVQPGRASRASKSPRLRPSTDTRSAAAWRSRWPVTSAIVAETAKLGLPEIQLGVIPGGGGTQRLARLVGPAIAKNLLYTGRQVDAEEAARIGLADEVVPAEPHPRARQGAGRELRRRVRRWRLRAAKLTVDEGLDLPLESGLALERSHFLALFGTEDRAIGMQFISGERAGQGEFRRPMRRHIALSGSTDALTARRRSTRRARRPRRLAGRLGALRSVHLGSEWARVTPMSSRTFRHSTSGKSPWSR